MTILNTQSAAMLDLLVAESRAASVGFRQAAASATDPRMQALLSNFAQLRAQLAGELERALAGLDLPENPRNTRRSSGDSRQDTSLDAGRHCAATIAECREHDEQILKQYQWVLKRDLPPPLRQIVSRQHAAMQADCQRLGELVTTMGAPPAGSADSNRTSSAGRT